MKSKIIILMSMISLYQFGCAQTFSEKINKEIAFEKVHEANAVIVSNISGSVKVEGYDGNKVILEVTKTITAKTNSRLEEGKEAIQLGIINRADTLIFYMISPCQSFGKQDRGEGNWSDYAWSYIWDERGRKNCEEMYDYNLDFVLKAPKSVNLLLSTVNNGNISVQNLDGAVKACNVNGAISLINISEASSASTINGNVDIEYTKNPDKDCRFYSLNGDINAWFQKGLGATMSFESFNGDFYTNIDQIENMPATIQKIDNEDGLKYKLQGNRYKIGQGGIYLDFETFNGNVYLKERNQN